MAPPKEIVVAVVGYVTCSSLALVANKVVMTFLQVPGLVFCLQLAATTAFLLVGSLCDAIQVDGFSAQNLRLFGPYMCSFVISLYSNGRALAASNMETIIVFRACSPLFVSVLDWWFLGRELPSARSTTSLVGVVLGAVGYMLADGQFALHGISAYKWVALNLSGIVFEMTYGKFLISGVSFRSPVWGATLYTNVLAFAPMLTLALSTGEANKLSTVRLDESAPLWLLLSCVVGTGISWAGWNCRSKVTATVYTLLGVVCKFISVLLNVLIWDKHASTLGLVALTICLTSSTLYRQAPPRQGLNESESLPCPIALAPPSSCAKDDKTS